LICLHSPIFILFCRRINILKAIMDIPQHPVAGAVTNQYMSSDDGSVKVPVVYINEESSKKIKEDINRYKWHSDDFLLATYPKNGMSYSVHSYFV